MELEKVVQKLAGGGKSISNVKRSCSCHNIFLVVGVVASTVGLLLLEALAGYDFSCCYNYCLK